MCTVVVSYEPAARVPLLLVGVRDELVDRPWLPPGQHWPDRPRLIGGIDLQAGGTWLAVDPEVPRIGCVLNGRGRPAPEATRQSRGELPLRVAADGKPDGVDLDRLDPFHLVRAEPAGVRLWSWDGERATERDLDPGLHIIVNSGLNGIVNSRLSEAANDHMAARIRYFRPRFAAHRPDPDLTGAPEQAWGDWLELAAGGGIAVTDERALVLRHELADGRAYGTTSVTLVALTPEGVRYDFCADPGLDAMWSPILP